MNRLNQQKIILGQLYEAKSSDEKFSILEEVIKDAGFDAVIYSFFPKLIRLSDTLQPFFNYSEGYAPLVKNYQENNLSRHDFLIRLVEEGYPGVIDWWEAAKSIELSDEEKQVNDLARNTFNITRGFAFPTLSSDLGIAGVSIISFDPEKEFEKIDTLALDQLHIIARMFHDHMMVHQDDRYQYILPLLDSLSEKKKIVLSHLISGQPMKKIKGVTERYADKLLLEIRKDFGNISKNELIYLVGLLNITEYL